jgi:hypothetical protein
MRKHKLAVMTAMYYIVANAKWERWINKLFEPTLEEVARQKAIHAKQWADIKDHFGVQVEAVQANMGLTQKVWKVARVKDDVVVLEAKTMREAQEAIEKAAKQKKAKLYLLDEEPYVYPYSEPDEGLVEYDPKNFVHMV